MDDVVQAEDVTQVVVKNVESFGETKLSKQLEENNDSIYNTTKDDYDTSFEKGGS